VFPKYVYKELNCIVLWSHLKVLDFLYTKHTRTWQCNANVLFYIL